VRLRLQGQEVDREALGAENGWPAIPRPITQQEWEKSCEQVLRANEELADLVATLSDHDLARPYAEGRALRSQLVHGVISHNCTPQSHRQSTADPIDTATASMLH
jgi:hypothetical protein